MTTEELVAHLATLPADTVVRLAVVDREGLCIDTFVAEIDDVRIDSTTAGTVWLAGASDDGHALERIAYRCHCGIVHEIDTAGTICPLPPHQR